MANTHTGTTTTERAMSAAIGRIYMIRPETADYIQNPLLVFVVDLSYCLLYMRPQQIEVIEFEH